MWDVEKATTVTTVFGPHICGDAVGVFGGTIVTGSWRDESQVCVPNVCVFGFLEASTELATKVITSIRYPSKQRRIRTAPMRVAEFVVIFKFC